MMRALGTERGKLGVILRGAHRRAEKSTLGIKKDTLRMTLRPIGT